LGNGVALELFAFVEPHAERPGPFAPWRGGFFHITLVDPDVEGALRPIAMHEGE